MPHPIGTLDEADRLLHSGQAGPALEIARTHLDRHAGDARAHLIAGQACLRTNDAATARDHLSRAVELLPQLSRAHRAMAGWHMQTGDWAGAIPWLESTIRLDPRALEPRLRLAAAMGECGRHDEAERLLRTLARRFGNEPDVPATLGALLSGRGRAGEGAQVLRDALAKSPDSVPLLVSLAVTLNYVYDATREEILDVHRRLGAALAAGVPAPPRLTNDPDPGRRLRVGYLSPDLRTHSVGFFAEPVIAHQSRESFEVFCYNSGGIEDETSERLKALDLTWRNVAPLNDQQLCEAIRSDRIDVLFELCGYFFGHRQGVMARRAAPVQATYIGYPNTTGLPTMDYRLVDARTDPEGADALATETLVRLPESFLCYRPPLDPLPPIAPPPSPRAGHVTFGSFNNAQKMSEPLVALWASVLGAVPGARILLKNRRFSDQGARETYLSIFTRQGIDASRVDIRPAAATTEDHLRTYNEVDIALDTFPYHGTTTTVEALSMGVPVVSLVGDRHAARVGLSLLTSVGQPDLAVCDEPGYIRVASALAADAERLAALRGTLRDRLLESPLCDQPRFSRSFDDACREMWSAWCRRGGP